MSGPLESDTIHMPVHWASYLINGDASGLEQHEVEACDNYMDSFYQDGWSVVDIAGEPYFTWHYRLYGGDADGGEVVEYIMLKH